MHKICLERPYRVKEVEEAVVLDRLGDGADVALRLVLLLLLDRLHRQVLALLPVDGAARALVDLGALEGEGVVLARLALHVVLLGEDRVGEVVVGVEVEVESEGLYGELTNLGTAPSKMNLEEMAFCQSRFSPLPSEEDSGHQISICIIQLF